MYTLNIRSPDYETAIGFGPTYDRIVKIMLVDVMSVRDPVYFYIHEDVIENLAEGDILPPNSLLTVC